MSIALKLGADGELQQLQSGDSLDIELLQVADIGAPGAPGAGLGNLYKLTGNDGLWWHPNGGSAVDLTAGGSGSPGGVDSNVQYNNGGSFGGDALFTWDDGTSLLTVNGVTVNVDGDIADVETMTFDGEHSNGSQAGAWTLDWNNGQKQSVTLTGNGVVTITAPPGPGTFTIRIIQDGTGTRVPTWPGTVNWRPGSGTPATSTSPGAVDVAVMYYDGTNYWATLAVEDEDTLVIGPGSSTNNSIARWDGATGEVLQGSSVLIDDSGNLQVVDAYMELDDIAAPGAPGAGIGRLYKLTADDGLWWHPNGGAAVDLTASGGTPGGADTNIQFNEAGVFGGDPAFLWNTGTQLFTVNGMTVDSGGNVGIVGDAASTAFALTVQNTTSSGEIIALVNDSGQNLFELRQDAAGEPFWFMLDSGGTAVMQLTNTATVDSYINLGQPLGIGTVSPGAGLVLDVVGDVDFTGAVEVDGVLTVLNNYVELDDIAAPGAGGAATGRLYKLTADDGLWWHPNGGSAVDLTAAGSPGGADTQLQFNNAGAFDGDALLTWNDGTSLFTVNGMTVASTGDVSIPGNLQVLDSYMELDDIAAPGAPGAAIGRLYKLTGNDGLWWHPNGGVAVDLTIAGSGSPGGVDHDVQFNNAGSFGGESLFTWNDTTNLLSINGLTIDTNGVLDLNDANLTDARTITFGTPGTDTSTSGVLNIDFSENQKRNHVLDENVTSVTFTAPPAAGNFMVRIEQAAGLFSLPAAVGSWPAAAEFVGDVAPVAPTADNNAILLGVYYDGTTYYFQTSGVFNN